MVINGQFPENRPRTEAACNVLSLARIRCNVNFVSRLFDRLLGNYFIRPRKFNVISGNPSLNGATAILTVNFANIVGGRKNGPFNCSRGNVARSAGNRRRLTSARAFLRAAGAQRDVLQITDAQKFKSNAIKIKFHARFISNRLP